MLQTATTTLTTHANKAAVDFLAADGAPQTLFERDEGKVFLHYDEIIVSQLNPTDVKVTFLWEGKACAEMALNCPMSSGANLHLLGIGGRISVSLG